MPTEAPAETPQEQALREALEASAGIGRLTKMSAVKSLHRNLKAEDAAVARNVELHERALFDDVPGGEAATLSAAASEDMENMAGRDVHIHYHSPSTVSTSLPGATGTPPPAAGVTPPTDAVALRVSSLPPAGLNATPISAWKRYATQAAVATMLVGGGVALPTFGSAIVGAFQQQPAAGEQPAAANKPTITIDGAEYELQLGD